MTQTRAPGDEPLAREAVAGDDAAFARLVESHTATVWRLAVSKLGDPHEAEDVTQETFLRAYRSLETWRGDAALRTWLHAICRNLCVDRLRARRLRTVSLEALVAAGAAPEGLRAGEQPTMEQQSLDRSALAGALEALSDDERDAFVLVDCLGFSGEEAARICEVPATTLRSRLHRGHRKLVDELSGGDAS